jgi:hypothetical protein
MSIVLGAEEDRGAGGSKRINTGRIVLIGANVPD